MNRQTVLDATQALRTTHVTARDGTSLFVQDWGRGRPVVFLAAWTFDASIWGNYIVALNDKGYRCVAPDRRGHGRSDMPMTGYDLETLTADVADIIEQRDLRDVTLVAYSMGSIEAVNYLGRYGSDRISRLVLVAPTTPFLVQTEDNPDAVPKVFVDAQNDAIARDYPKWLTENEAPFFVPDTPQIVRSWIMNMMLSVPLPVAMACRKTISFADLRAAAAKIEVPTLIVQGDKDASAPLEISGAKTARLIKGSELKVYEGAPHGLPLTHGERLFADVVDFLEA
ncbi:MAG: alpha/beta hydrolase [Bradyrhizobium sp.]|nr:alpha/beta hydrolase [Bradyrhizobium sp.]